MGMAPMTEISLPTRTPGVFLSIKNAVNRFLADASLSVTAIRMKKIR
jgi:hypothetical protein